jgi:hypothetical protein
MLWCLGTQAWEDLATQAYKLEEEPGPVHSRSPTVLDRKTYPKGVKASMLPSALAVLLCNNLQKANFTQIILESKKKETDLGINSRLKVK